jgi:hypothetical protein
MTVKSLLKKCGCVLVEIRESSEDKEFERVAVVDYDMEGIKNDGIYFPTRVSVTEKILNRKVDFFTTSQCYDYLNRYKDCIEVYVK